MGSVKEKMQNFAIQQALQYIEGNPEENIPKLMALVDRFSPEGWYQSQRSAVREAIRRKDNWYQLILRVYELDPGVRKAFFQNFLMNASLKGSAVQNEVKERGGATFPGRFFWIPPPPATCAARAAGLPSTATSSISAWKRLIP